MRQRFWDGQDKMLRDDVTKIKGNHLITFGGQYQRNYDYHLRNDNGQGIMNSPVYQITSGGACHPETHMVAAALAEPDAEIVEVSYTTGVGLDTRRQWIDARVGEC